jgi:hypothetical protein
MMADLDLAHLLSTGLNTLHLQPDEITPEPLSTFTLFPDLPIELRLKVFEHALPRHQTLQVRANILLADPDFGLYLTFSISPPSYTSGSFGAVDTLAMIAWYKSARALNLLSANKECRSIYLENFPCTLPSGPPNYGGRGKIRFSPKEAIHIHNFDKLIQEGEILRAINHDWRLQQCFQEIQRLILPITYFMTGIGDTRAKILRKFTALREVRGKMWKRFGEEMNDGVMEQIRLGMKVALMDVEDKLRAWKREHDESYEVPRIELLD